jgi:hypothetical protein
MQTIAEFLAPGRTNSDRIGLFRSQTLYRVGGRCPNCLKTHGHQSDQDGRHPGYYKYPGADRDVITEFSVGIDLFPDDDKIHFICVILDYSNICQLLVPLLEF